jgi:hypothetical protein
LPVVAQQLANPGIVPAPMAIFVVTKHADRLIPGALERSSAGRVALDDQVTSFSRFNASNA